MIRITSGQYGGRLLKVPDGIRPTQDRVRKAMFDILGMDVPGRRVLDLFAGSGALGLEALSRGASSVLFVDEGVRAIRAVRENLTALGLGSGAGTGGGGDRGRGTRPESAPTEGDPRIEVWQTDYQRALRRLGQAGRTVDLVLLDPPYREEIIPEVLDGLVAGLILDPGSLVVAEAESRCPTPEGAGLSLLTDRTYGGTKLMFWLKRET